MKLYDVIAMRRVVAERYDADGKMRSAITYKADKGQTFVFLLLSVQDTKSMDAFDAEAELNAMGWTFAPSTDTGEA